MHPQLKMKITKIFYFILFLLLSSDVFAQNTALSDKLTKLHSMQAHFSQTIHDAHGRVLDQSEGTMALQRPGKFRWETIKPHQQLVIVSEKVIWIYDKDLAQAVKQKRRSENNSFSPALLLSSTNQKILEDFIITENKKNIFLLKPRKDRELFKKIILQFNQEALQSMTMEDQLGQNTSVQFSNIKLNKPIPERDFIFKPTHDTEVIDQT